MFVSFDITMELSRAMSNTLTRLNMCARLSSVSSSVCYICIQFLLISRRIARLKVLLSVFKNDKSTSWQAISRISILETIGNGGFAIPRAESSENCCSLHRLFAHNDMR
jgi:hypothetical protein